MQIVESPEKEGYPAPGFAYHSNEDVAIGLLKKGYLKVDRLRHYLLIFLRNKEAEQVLPSASFLPPLPIFSLIKTEGLIIIEIKIPDKL